MHPTEAFATCKALQKDLIAIGLTALVALVSEPAEDDP